MASLSPIPLAKLSYLDEFPQPNKLYSIVHFAKQAVFDLALLDAQVDRL